MNVIFFLITNLRRNKILEKFKKKKKLVKKKGSLKVKR